MTDGTITAQELRAARVFVHKNDDDYVILCMTGSLNGDVHYVIAREEFVRLTQSLNQDAMRLSTMQKAGSVS